MIDKVCDLIEQVPKLYLDGIINTVGSLAVSPQELSSNSDSAKLLLKLEHWRAEYSVFKSVFIGNENSINILLLTVTIGAVA